jgi:hypothetical protein
MMSYQHLEEIEMSVRLKRGQRPAWESTPIGKLLITAGLNQSSGARAVGISDRRMREFVWGRAEVPIAITLALKYLAKTSK